MQGKALIYGVQKKYYMNMAICLGLISMGQLMHTSPSNMVFEQTLKYMYAHIKITGWRLEL